MKSQHIARYAGPFSLVLTQGSITEFQHSNGAIVNAANEECLGGGGVDGCISDAGGRTLFQHRLALPILENDDEGYPVRCPTGQAKITGPGKYGSLGVDYVIHAVGPQYSRDENKTQDDVDDGLLRSAYQESMMRAKECKLEAVAFSLLSAGIFRGHRSLEAVLRIGVEEVCDFGGYEELNEVYFFGFTKKEMATLQQITSDMKVPEREGTATICKGEETGSCDAQSAVSEDVLKPMETENDAQAAASKDVLNPKETENDAQSAVSEDVLKPKETENDARSAASEGVLKAKETENDAESTTSEYILKSNATENDTDNKNSKRKKLNP